jgi:endonuclease/exonuclease/phosphatase family metal-dependent hydrolase
VHLDSVSQTSREKSVVLLMQRVAARQVTTDPFIITGDFNAGETNLATRYMKGAAMIDGMTNPLPRVDSFRELFPNANNAGTSGGFTGATNGGKIDYIYIGTGEKALDAEIIHTNVNGRYPSDHYPVRATIDMLDW